MKVLTMGPDLKLVEFEDGGIPRRVWVPLNAELKKRELRKGVDYGITEDDLVELFEGLTPEAAAQRLVVGLRRRGVWTKQDIDKAGAASALVTALWDALGVRPSDVVVFMKRR